MRHRGPQLGSGRGLRDSGHPERRYRAHRLLASSRLAAAKKLVVNKLVVKMLKTKADEHSHSLDGTRVRPSRVNVLTVSSSSSFSERRSSPHYR